MINNNNNACNKDKIAIVSSLHVDIHTHILPGIDDGASSMSQTIRMLEQAYEEGIRTIIATPHFGIRNPSFDISKAGRLLEKTQAAADEFIPGIRILPGNEIYYTDGVVAALKRGEAWTLAGSNYVLVEFSPGDSAERILHGTEQFAAAGYTPVVAHLERYRALENDTAAVSNLIACGARVQINCRSVIYDAIAGRKDEYERDHNQIIVGRHRGIFGKRLSTSRILDAGSVRRGLWSLKLIDEGFVHFLASDCHNDASRRPVYREAAEIIRQRWGEDRLHEIININPQKIIAGEYAARK